MTCRCVDSMTAFVSWNLLSSSVALLINSHTAEYSCRTCTFRFSSLKTIIVPRMVLCCTNLISSVLTVTSTLSFSVVSFMNGMLFVFLLVVFLFPLEIYFVVIVEQDLLELMEVDDIIVCVLEFKVECVGVEAILDLIVFVDEPSAVHDFLEA